MKNFATEKKLVREYMEAMQVCAPDAVAQVLAQYTAPDYTWEGVFPFMDLTGAQAVADTFWTPLKQSLTQMQRRQDVFMAGETDDGKTWVVSMGHFMGLYDQAWLDIPRTCKMHHLQYTEFSQVADNRIVHTALYVDMVGFMQEAGVYPLSPETGHYFVFPGPCDHNGLLFEPQDPAKGAQSKAIVKQMLTDMYTAQGDENEIMLKTWSEQMIWYGPCGVGATYTLPRYQIQHNQPFCKHLCDRVNLGRHAFIGEGDFAAFYTNLDMTSKGGWLGMSGENKNVILRGDLDIYYCKDGKILENWCMFDIPYWLYQQGVNIFERTASILNPSI